MVVTNNCYSISYDGGEKNSIINIPFPSHSFITFLYIYIYIFFFQPLIYYLCIYSILFFNSKSNTIKTHSFFFYHSDPFHYFSLLHRRQQQQRRNMETPRNNPFYFFVLHQKNKIKESTPLFLSHQWPSWTKIYV